MALCEDCNQEMTTADGCTLPRLQIDREVYRRSLDSFGGARCHDCGARRGHVHHYGCDEERCPSCRRQLVSCGCGCDWETDEVRVQPVP